MGRSLAATLRELQRRKPVARKTVLVSDLSGHEIAEGKGAKIRIAYEDARKGAAELDVTQEEADELARKGRRTARRGRKPRAAASGS